MADANGNLPGSPDYDPSTDPGVQADQPGPLPTGQPQPSDATEGSTGQYGGQNSSELQTLYKLLDIHKDNPQQAVDEFNQYYPGSTLKPAYYPHAGKGVIGVQGQSLPYLTAPGTVSGQTTWNFGGVPGGDRNSGGAAGGQVDPYTSLATPAGLQTPYTAERFQGPTLDDLLKSPGYDVGLDTTFKGIERHQAAQGSILSGGARQALIKGGQDYAKRSYGDLYNQYLNAYTANGNQNLGARQQNNSEFQQAVGNNLNQYNTRYKTYKDAIDNSFNLADLGVRATQAGAPA